MKLNSSQNIEQIWVTVQCSVWSWTVVRNVWVNLYILGWRTELHSSVQVYLGWSLRWLDAAPTASPALCLLARHSWRETFWNIPPFQVWLGFIRSLVLGLCCVWGQARLLGAQAEHRRDSGQPVFLESQGKLCVSNRCWSPCREQEINWELLGLSWTWKQPSFLLLHQSWPKNSGILVSWSCPFHSWALHTLPQAEARRLLNSECSLFVGGRKKWEGRRCTWRQGGEKLQG